jgi:transposase
MGKIKNYSYEQTVMIPVNLKNQVLPGTFEYTLNALIDNEVDLTLFYERIHNDESGAPAYDPAILLKIVLFAYSRGIISSREIARFCRENVICMALSADTAPHFTTIANFISVEEKGIVDLFTRVLSVCYTQNLIGKNMFAIDGCKLSSNCSKEWSGTRKELLKKAEKIESSVRYLVDKQKKADKNTYNTSQESKEKKSIQSLKARAAKIQEWLNLNDAKTGARGTEIKSNITDNESAKMSTGHGVVQGYNGIAAVDDKNQVIVWAEAFGDINESGHLPEIFTAVDQTCKESGISNRIYDEVVVTADSGFHNEKNMELIYEEGITAFIADNQFRKRDVKFDGSEKHKKKVANWEPEKGKHYFVPDDFKFNPLTGKLMCPAGYPMWLKSRNFKSGKYRGRSYMGHIENCLSCTLRSGCIRKDETKARQVTKLDVDKLDGKESFTAKMRKRFDTPEGRSLYSKRMGTVEPVFGHLREVLRLNRFTLRSKKKVNNQWLLYCIIHNIGKIQRYGMI